MQAVAAEFPGCAENSTAFWREEFKTLRKLQLLQRRTGQKLELSLTRVCVQRSRQQTALEIAEMYHYLSSL